MPLSPLSFRLLEKTPAAMMSLVNSLYTLIFSQGRFTACSPTTIVHPFELRYCVASLLVNWAQIGHSFLFSKLAKVADQAHTFIFQKQQEPE